MDWQNINLRSILKGILTAGSHILSRLPAKTKDYQQIIISLGEYGIIQEFEIKTGDSQVLKNSA